MITRPPNVIPSHQLPALRSGMDLLPYPGRLGAHLMIETGIRVGELCKLAWADVVWMDQPKTLLEIPATAAKTKHARQLPITPRLLVELKSAVRSHYLEHQFGPSHYLMARRPNGKPISIRTLERVIAALGRKCIGQRITPHTLRHTFATRLLAVSDLRCVQDALGHARVGTTQMYTHPGPDRLADVMQRMD